MVSGYAEKHRPAPAEDCSEYIFLTPQGRKVAHLSDDLKALSKDFPTTLGVVNMTTTQMRKLTSTQVAAEGATDATIRTVATHMTHGADTARKYYQHLEGVSQSVAAFGEISRKRSADPAENDELIVPKLKKRKMWLKEEEQEIREKIDMGKTPTLEQCQAFLSANTDAKLFSERTAKELQDKCRTIHRQTQKNE